jgi:hemerythrin
MDDKLTWTNDYSVNVVEIDEQHKEFLNIIKSLLDLESQESFTDEEAIEKVAQLCDYASYHLSTEEELFIKTGYDDGGNHLHAHNMFRAKAKDFLRLIRDNNENKKEALKEVSDFAGNWMIHHILNMDKEYSEFFNKKGIK